MQLSIPVFRGSRLRGVKNSTERLLNELTFQSPFSGDLDCEPEFTYPLRIKEFIFQSPFSGDLDCEARNSGCVADVDVHPVFQSPFSGDLDCEYSPNPITRESLLRLSIPVFRGSRLREHKGIRLIFVG